MADPPGVACRLKASNPSGITTGRPIATRPDSPSVPTDRGEARAPSVAFVASSPFVFLNFFMETFREMKARGFDVLLFCPEGPPVKRFEEEGFTFVRIPMGRTVNPGAALVTWLLLHSAFLERRPLLVHSHTTTVHLISALAARSAGVPVSLATVHGHYETGLEQLVGGGRARVIASMTERYAAAVGQLVDAYIVINETEARRMGRVLPSDKLHYIEGGVGVDLDLYEGSSGKREARRRLRLAEGKRQVGFIGRLVDHKARDLLGILDQIHQVEPGVGVLLVLLMEGEPALEAALQARIDAGRDIVVLRDRAPEEMPLIYKALDLVLLPSFREGANTVLMEAAAMRVPAIAYDIAGTRDIVEEGRTGRLVEVGDRSAFAEAATALLRSPTRRREMGAAARARAALRFGRAGIQAKIFALYDRLIDLKIRARDL